MSLELPQIPVVESKKIKITNFTEGFIFKITPPDVENDISEIQEYRIYGSQEDVLSDVPNINNKKNLILQFNFSNNLQYGYFLPKNTGNYFFKAFSKSQLGFESSGISFSGQINSLDFIKEINFKNLNFYLNEHNSMFPDFSGSFSNSSHSSIIGWEFDFIAPTTEEFKSYIPEIRNINLENYLDTNNIKFFERVIPKSNNNLILSNRTLLKDFSNDIRQLNYDHISPVKSSTNLTSYSIPDPGPLYTTGAEALTRQKNTRFAIFNSEDNLNAYIEKNTFYVEGYSNLGQTFFNPEKQSISGFLGDRIQGFTESGYIPKNYLQVSTPGYYDKYYFVIEAVNQSGDSSAGGNVYNNTTKEARYTNISGYKIVEINHNDIDRAEVIKLFKEYKRETDESISFIFKNTLPKNIGLESVIIFPQKYNKNINNNQDKEREEGFIYINNLYKLEDNLSFKNFPVEKIDDQNNSIYKLTVKLSTDSLLSKDTIFSCKIYYLNPLQASIFESFLTAFKSSITNDEAKSFINSNNLIDKYITLNKFIKNNPNYTSTIAASYQGLVYFFTKESYKNIAWPDQSYTNTYFNNRGARMLDFERDGFSTGPQFFNYFPRCQGKIANNIFPNDDAYKTTYRCLDSYKYSTSFNSISICPEDVPTSGINDNPAYLGVWDPGNIGDPDSPQEKDFKYICNDLKLFSAKNIYSVNVLSVGEQGEDAYSIVEFVLDLPDAEDFIVQGISGTDTVLEKGIKQINGVNYHYFVAKFISSCGINDDPILNGKKVNSTNIIDSKKIVSFVIYPTKLKIFEDEADTPYFGKYYLFANSVSNNEFTFLKSCPTNYINLINSTDCVDGCCVEESLIASRTPNKSFYILSNHTESTDPNVQLLYGKILNTENNVIGSFDWRFLALNYSNNNHILYYQKPTISNSTLYAMINFMPEHDVALYKVAIYIKQTDNININSNDWNGSDLIETYQFNEIVKSSPIMISLPDFKYSKLSQEIYNNIISQYTSWINDGKTFAVRIVVIDYSGDKIEQTFVFVNQS